MTATLAPMLHPAAPSGAHRLLDGAGPDLDAHLRRYGPLPWQGSPGALLPVAEAAGLTGRGGAGFPAWRKLAAVAAGDRAVVVANAAESEPASSKDRTLLARSPHLVLDGLQLAAEAVGAGRGWVYVAAGPADGIRRLLAHRRAAGVDLIPIEVAVAPDTFIAGEESAVVSALEGRPALPRDKARRVVEAGVRRRPTLVHNVETLAHLALLARYGAGWFRSQGTAAEPGTMLASVSGAVAVPGVHEVAIGTPLVELLSRAGGVTSPLQAVLVGGFHGGWLGAGDLGHALLSRAGLAPLGVSPGAGVVVALSRSVCGLAESARIAGYLAGQSARQCGPCRNGLPAMAELLGRLAARERDPRLVTEVQRLGGLVAGRGACHHPDGTVRFVRSSLQVFSDEVALHLAGSCSASAGSGR